MLSPTASPLPVLVVDDIEDNLLVTEALLRRPGVEILCARSGPEALELLLQHDIVLALLDVQMPDMDGFELAELMRGAERTRSIPIIFVTAGVRDRQRVFRGYELGAVDFLVKPIEPVILRQKVDVFLELHRQKERLADALRLNETFVAVMAHDLRTPLSSIAMSVGILERSSDPMSVALADRLRGSTDRMAGMIEQLCDLSRVRLGDGFQLERKPFDLVALVQRCVHELEVQVPGRAFVLELPGELHVVGDEGRMARVLANVIGNAVRHGDPARPVEVRARTEHDVAIVEVRNGGTIAPEAHAQLFQPFKSHARNGGSREGLGLGMYIAQQIVVAHGGTIDATCEHGRTTVRITLPRAGG